jgi:hypothetical protein
LCVAAILSIIPIVFGGCSNSTASKADTTPTQGTASKTAEESPKATPSASEGTEEEGPKQPTDSKMTVPESKTGMLSNATPNASKDRSNEQIKEVMVKNRDLFRLCYEKALSHDKSLRGQYIIKFVLDPKGGVKEAKGDLDRSEIKDSKMDECMAKTLKQLTFPASKRGMESTISYPFGFTPGGGGKKR